VPVPAFYHYHYHWPENDLELERIVARVMALANNNPIGLDELSLHAPELIADPPANLTSRPADYNNFIDNLIPQLMKKDYDCLSRAPYD
jgi:transcriptional regulator of acetoin/glycerol metabolism